MKLSSIIRSGALALAVTLTSHHTQAREYEYRSPRGDRGGAVYTMDNATNANHILAYRRGADGSLTPSGAYPTGGRGTGGGLGSQGAVILSPNGRWLFACNAGSDEVSVFFVTPAGLVPTHKASSRGRHPISLALHGNLLFVLNAGGRVGDQDLVAGFLFYAGELIPLAQAAHPLSADDTNPAQIGFSSNGDVLVVTEKDTGVIDTFSVDNDGSIVEARQFQSSGQTPFGFAFRGRDLIVSEAFGGAADASAASSYRLDEGGALELTSPSVPTTETSACWAVVTGNGRFAYVANTGSGTISGYQIAVDGAVSLLHADGVTGITGEDSSPADLAVSVNSRYLYSRNGNGTLSAFRVGANGSLSPLSGVSGLPEGTTGLAAR